MLSIGSRLAVLTAILLLSACTSLWQMGASTSMREGVSSSLVDYLYPKGNEPPVQSTDIPQLNVPLRAGIAFVPPQYGADSAITETTKLELLNKVKAAFLDRDYIRHIEVIPETYLRSSRGFEGMQQVARLYSVDVMALVSYDQVAVSADTKASVLYWTIVGAYLIKGTENEIQTFVDTAVFDVPSRKLLFRAPGLDRQEFRSTAIESNETTREGRASSFAAAMANMTENLSSELAVFEERLKSEPQLAQVNRRSGSGGGGSTGFPGIVFLIVMGFVRRYHRTLP